MRVLLHVFMILATLAGVLAEIDFSRNLTEDERGALENRTYVDSQGRFVINYTPLSMNYELTAYSRTHIVGDHGLYALEADRCVGQYTTAVDRLTLTYEVYANRERLCPQIDVQHTFCTAVPLKDYDRYLVRSSPFCQRDDTYQYVLPRLPFNTERTLTFTEEPGRFSWWYGEGQGGGGGCALEGNCISPDGTFERNVSQTWTEFASWRYLTPIPPGLCTDKALASLQIFVSGSWTKVTPTTPIETFDTNPVNINGDQITCDPLTSPHAQWILNVTSAAAGQNWSMRVRFVKSGSASQNNGFQVNVPALPVTPPLVTTNFTNNSNHSFGVPVFIVANTSDVDGDLLNVSLILDGVLVESFGIGGFDNLTTFNVTPNVGLHNFSLLVFDAGGLSNSTGLFFFIVSGDLEWELAVTILVGGVLVALTLVAFWRKEEEEEQ